MKGDELKPDLATASGRGQLHRVNGSRIKKPGAKLQVRGLFGQVIKNEHWERDHLDEGYSHLLGT